MATKSDIAQILSVLSAAFPNFKMQDNTPEIYLQLLADLPVDLLKAAVLKCCGEAGRAFAPSIGEIRGAAMQIKRLALAIPSALEAWNEVGRAWDGDGVIDVGEGPDGPWILKGPFAWSNPLPERVARLLGWPATFPGDNPVADRAHFMKAYEQAVTDALQRDTELPQVTKYIETHTLAAIKQLTEGMSK